MPYDPNKVLSKLDIPLRTPIPTVASPAEGNPWISKTLLNPQEADSQTGLIKARISNHQNGLPTPMLDAVDQFAGEQRQ